MKIRRRPNRSHGAAEYWVLQKTKLRERPIVYQSGSQKTTLMEKQLSQRERELQIKTFGENRFWCAAASQNLNKLLGRAFFCGHTMDRALRSRPAQYIKELLSCLSLQRLHIRDFCQVLQRDFLFFKHTAGKVSSFNTRKYKKGKHSFFRARALFLSRARTRLTERREPSARLPRISKKHENSWCSRLRAKTLDKTVHEHKEVRPGAKQHPACKKTFQTDNEISSHRLS